MGAGPGTVAAGITDEGRPQATYKVTGWQRKMAIKNSGTCPLHTPHLPGPVAVQRGWRRGGLLFVRRFLLSTLLKVPHFSLRSRPVSAAGIRSPPEAAQPWLWLTCININASARGNGPQPVPSTRGFGGRVLWGTSPCFPCPGLDTSSPPRSRHTGVAVRFPARFRGREAQSGGVAPRDRRRKSSKVDVDHMPVFRRHALMKEKRQ